MRKNESYMTLVINRLFGDRNITVCINDDVTIINAENGKGKTTVLQFIFALLTGRFNLLMRYDFDSIKVIKGDLKVEVSKQQMFIEFSSEFKKIRHLLGDEDSNKMINMITSFSSEDLLKNDLRISIRNSLVKEISTKHKIPTGYIMKMIESALYLSERSDSLDIFENTKFEWKKSLARIHEEHVVFWPTFRRVEKSFKLDSGEQIEGSESFAFGMGDIEKKITELERELSVESLSLASSVNKYLIVDTLTAKKPPEKFYKQSKNRINEISVMLDRTQIIKEKNELIQLIENGDIVDDKYIPLAQIIFRLLEGFESLAEKDAKIKRFVTAVNNYLVDNELVYDERIARIFCRSKLSGRQIKLEYLSSGEKHIISFMSHLYLFEKNKCVIIIDEPELSLSSEWQEKLLVDIMSSGSVKQLICATHSPFIFNNKYDINSVPLYVEVAKNVAKSN